MVRNGKRLYLGALALLALVAWAAPLPAHAAGMPTPTSAPAADDSEEAVIPKAPSAPPKLLAPKAIETFGCDRYFAYKGQRLTCDSDVRRDAENLRIVVRDVPPAVAELDAYDLSRHKVQSAAYVGSAGLLLALAGVLLASHVISDPNQQIAVRNLSVISGLGISAGAFIYGSSVIRTNEARIGNAVNDFNAVHPESPIELQFSTGITF